MTEPAKAPVLNNPAIEFHQIRKSYADLTVINDVTLSIPDNQTTAIVGESGSGKSTLLQLINGLVIPELGTVSLFGAPLNYADLPGVRRDMGYAVQGAGLFPHMTVTENINLMARMEGWSDARVNERVAYLLDLLSLDPELTERYPHELSGGQQHRVSLCRAMMLNPRLMLLDEPFSALDPITRASIHDEFLKLQAAEARAIVLVTHDMFEAAKLASHLVIIGDGEVLQEGSLADIRDNPDSEYVEKLFAGAS